MLAVVILLLSVLVMCGADCGRTRLWSIGFVHYEYEYYLGHEVQMSSRYSIVEM